MSLDTYMEKYTGFPATITPTQTFNVIETPLFVVNYKLIHDAAVIKWLQSFDPCNKHLQVGTCVVKAFKEWSRDTQLRLIAEGVADDATPFWRKVSFFPTGEGEPDYIWNGQ